MATINKNVDILARYTYLSVKRRIEWKILRELDVN